LSISYKNIDRIWGNMIDERAVDASLQMAIENLKMSPVPAQTFAHITELLESIDKTLKEVLVELKSK